MKRLLAIIPLLLCLSARADWFGTDAATTNAMHAETNYFIFVKGSAQGSTVWKISPSNAVEVIDGLSWNFVKPLKFAPQTNSLAGAGTTNLVIDGGQAALVRCVPGANFGLLFTNLVDGQEGRIEIKQDATGIRTLAIPDYGNVKFGTDITSLTLSTNAAYIDHIKWVVRNTNAHIVGFIRGMTE